MRLAIDLARENASHGGGPFGAILVEAESGRVVAPGVNLVVPLNCSMAHAEMVAISIAQQLERSHDLGASGLPALQLVTSTEPCAMCLGAIPWSGITSLVCGAGGDVPSGSASTRATSPNDGPNCSRAAVSPCFGASAARRPPGY